jgi:hypothetical protein
LPEQGSGAAFSWTKYRRNREWQAAAGTALVVLFLWLKLKFL